MTIIIAREGRQSSPLEVRDIIPIKIQDGKINNKQILLMPEVSDGRYSCAYVHLLRMVVMDIVQKRAAGGEEEAECLGKRGHIKGQKSTSKKCIQIKVGCQTKALMPVIVAQLSRSSRPDLEHGEGDNGEEPMLAARDPAALRVLVHQGADRQPGLPLTITLRKELWQHMSFLGLI